MTILEIAILALVAIGALTIVMFFYSMVRFRATLTFADIRNAFSHEELRGTLIEQTSKKGVSIVNVFGISGQMIKCKYSQKVIIESILPNNTQEKICITVSGKLGMFNAVFYNAKLISWNIGLTNEISMDMDSQQLWQLKEIFGRIQNAAGLAMPKRSTYC